MHLLAFLGLFPDRNVRFPFPIIYLQLVKFLPFHIHAVWQLYTFRTEPPRLAHNREYPAPRDDALGIAAPFILSPLFLRRKRSGWNDEIADIHLTRCRAGLNDLPIGKIFHFWSYNARFNLTCYHSPGQLPGQVQPFSPGVENCLKGSCPRVRGWGK